MPVGMLCVKMSIFHDYEYIETTLKRILGIKERKDVEFKLDNPIEILSSPLDEMIDKYIKECLEKNGLSKLFSS